MGVSFLDLAGPTQAVRAKVMARWQGILDSSGFVLGEENREFEANFARFVGASHCVAVNSGTDALHLAFAALGIEPGDIVVAPANTFIASCAPAIHLGADLRLVNPGSDQTICVEELRVLCQQLATAGKRVKAVIAVHLYGQPANLAGLQQLASEYGFQLVEDCAQAHGATLENGAVGSFGDLACFSFYPGKNLGAFGDGGAVVTGNAALAQRLRLLRNHGSERKYVHETLGFCSRLDEMQAAVLNEKLALLPQWTAQRQQAASHYRQRLAKTSGLLLPEVSPRGDSVFHLFVVRVLNGRRDALQQHLRQQDITTLIHYPVPIHQHEAFRGRLIDLPDLSATETLCGEILSLPLYPELPTAHIDEVCGAILDFL